MAWGIGGYWVEGGDGGEGEEWRGWRRGWEGRGR